MLKDPSGLGTNRTGILTSPIDSKKMLSDAKIGFIRSEGSDLNLLQIRNYYLNQSCSIGSVPVPLSLKENTHNALQKLVGKRPETLMDKLGERLAFERTGTRLYEALMNKCEISCDGMMKNRFSFLEQFRDEEAQHFELVREAIENLGGDSTAMTPSADLSGVASSGLLKIITDPRTSMSASIHALLIAELTDHNGWEILIQITERMRLNEVSGQFKQALIEEENHLHVIRRIHEETVLAEAKAA
jgi:ferritin-like protein